MFYSKEVAPFKFNYPEWISKYQREDSTLDDELYSDILGGPNGKDDIDEISPGSINIYSDDSIFNTDELLDDDAKDKRITNDLSSVCREVRGIVDFSMKPLKSKVTKSNIKSLKYIISKLEKKIPKHDKHLIPEGCDFRRLLTDMFIKASMIDDKIVKSQLTKRIEKLYDRL